MNTQGWLHRLTEQFPGWHVWIIGSNWRAVPAPATATLLDAIDLPKRISADTPQQLRELMSERYGWDDYCETCCALARMCGHRRPETRQAP
jgi:hypothetical protein